MIPRVRTELMNVIFSGWPTLVCPCVRVHRRTSLMSSPWYIQQSPAWLSHFLKWFMRWEVSDRTTTVLLGTVSRICSKQHVELLRSFLQNFFCKLFVKVQVVQPYSNTDADNAKIEQEIRFLEWSPAKRHEKDLECFVMESSWKHWFPSYHRS